MSDTTCECGKRKSKTNLVCRDCRWHYDPEAHWRIRTEKELAAREVDRQNTERVRVRRMVL